ncbi:phospho-sugar mutase [Paludicola sp. MB14-C6]|uniref:phospho-sugar mutase n=1 Tax=Paludihabitans sp. MB14-C6 TaxID=3070656 RepID=UPI0027DD04E5|nr:phospho-sugar mutase [Paludicola sp. MB14-C6]WMJ23800.1 phospho-sugar mutase [Paludicola sp. MB14-C6]
MEEMQLYNVWTRTELDDTDLRDELAAINGDVDAIKDRFYRDLEFGTGGLRGVIGAGTNRINVYTIRKATQGLANYLIAESNNPSVAIGYDSRIKSDLFAKEAARVLSANGIKVYLYDKLMPTPCLSFAVRELNCEAGIMITASHNPAKYNGYKVYGNDGCQITIEAADRVLSEINQVDLFHVELEDFDKALNEGNIEYISKEVEDRYLANVKAQLINPKAVEQANLKVVYTPLNGTGNLPVRNILSMVGVKDVVVVPEQEKPDGTFRTCPFPNPEIPEALNLGLKLCEQEKPDLLLATDPDCDRVGIAVPDHNGNYVLVTGNEVGSLLLEYICEQRTKNGSMPKNPVAVKTIVTTELAKKIAQNYGVEIIDVLTGFKFIGEQIYVLEQKNEQDRYIFGFEESYGYLAGTYVRDKDGVVASMLICEMAGYYKLNGISILDALNRIYETYGVYIHEQQSFTCEGETGMQRMNEIMSGLREQPPVTIGGFEVIKIADYQSSEMTDMKTSNKTTIDLPKSNVLSYELCNGASVVLRPSGTEPKIKAYYTATGKTKEQAKSVLAEVQKDYTKILGF